MAGIRAPTDAVGKPPSLMIGSGANGGSRTRMAGRDMRELMFNRVHSLHEAGESAETARLASRPGYRTVRRRPDLLGCRGSSVREATRHADREPDGESRCTEVTVAQLRSDASASDALPQHDEEAQGRRSGCMHGSVTQSAQAFTASNLPEHILCTNWARSDLCERRAVLRVPTAIGSPRRANIWSSPSQLRAMRHCRATRLASRYGRFQGYQTT